MAVAVVAAMLLLLLLQLLVQLLVQLMVIYSCLSGLCKMFTRCIAPSSFCWRYGRTEMICDCLCDITLRR